MKRIIIIVVSVAVLAGGIMGWQAYSRDKQQQELLASLETQPLEKGTLVASIGATGQVRSNQSALLAWKTSGTVDRVAVKVGDAVTVDTELAAL